MLQQQTEIFEAHVGNANTFEVYLEDPPPDPADNGPGTPIVGADVFFSLYDEFGTAVPGAIWPMAMTETGSPGWYQLITSSNVVWNHMTAYYGEVVFANEVKLVPAIVAYNRTLQQPTQQQLRSVAKKAGLSI